MKKRLNMPSKQEFQAMYPSKNSAFDASIRAALDGLTDTGRRRTSRKFSVGLMAAVILVLALVH